jgi:hypothetical protein
VSAAAFAVINAQTKAQGGYDTSSVINCIVESSARKVELAAE